MPASVPKKNKEIKVVSIEWWKRPPIKLNKHTQIAWDEFVEVLRESNLLRREFATVLLDLAMNQGVYYQLAEKLQARQNLIIKRGQNGHEQISELEEMELAAARVRENLKFLGIKGQAIKATPQQETKGNEVDSKQDNSTTPGQRKVNNILFG